MSSDPMPRETEELLAELAALVSFTIGERTPCDWPSIEAALGVRLPAQYKAYVERFPPGMIRWLRIYHPGLSESPPWPKPWGLVEAAKGLGPRMDGLSLPARYHGYPKPGGLIPWADCEGDYFLCWLPNDDDPDLWQVVAFNAEGDEGSNSEIIEGSTLQALIRVIRGDSGRSVFPEFFYEESAEFIQALPEDEQPPS